MTIELFAVMNDAGQYMRSRGYSGGGKSWVKDLINAKMYTKISQAKARVTFWQRHYPEFGVPKIIVLEAYVKSILNQEKRVSVVNKAHKIHELNAEKIYNERRKVEIQRKLTSLTEELKDIR